KGSHRIFIPYFQLLIQINNKNRPFHARNPRKRLRRHPYANESFASLSTCKSGNVCYLCNGFVSEVTN
ncbi:hypothetical protein, partial [Alistipes shahii]|uniref:hypothetical protein n=1 Tax=Alistipes shahii TaxID=328814 RepID=UPI00307ADA38